MQFHLVYIHGFQGDQTTFQSFPTDLQTFLQAAIPSSSGISVRTSIYPTYKSIKSISYATKNFLEWLSTQPPGPIILLGHSMGGLLAADAAIHPSNLPPSPSTSSASLGYGYYGDKPQRIVGVIAFDTPYLGMHPHVVISGIASLFPDHKKDHKKKGGQPVKGAKGTEEEVNDQKKVKIVDEGVTEPWEDVGEDLPSPALSTASTSSSKSTKYLNEVSSIISNASHSSFARWAWKHADDPLTASKRWVTERLEFGGAMFDVSALNERYRRLVGWSGLWANYWTETVKRTVYEEGEEEEKENYEQESKGGSANVKGEELGGEGTVERKRMDEEHKSERGRADVEKDQGTGEAETLEKEHATETTEDLSSSESPSSSTESHPDDHSKRQKPKHNKLQKEHRPHPSSPPHPKLKKPKKIQRHHFVVLPNGLASALGGFDKWEKVPIAGVEDEVGAHCGLFIRGQNEDYDGLVQRVGEKVIRWCKEVEGWDNRSSRE